jgi:hypothetical protein
VRNQRTFAQGLFVNSEAVILNGNLDFTGRFIPHRMITSAMAEFELVRLSTQRLPQDLMSKADTEHRDLTQEILNWLYNIAQCGWITGTI